MFGYLESPYTVLKAATLTVRNGTQHFELRQPNGDNPQPYISLLGKDAGGRQTFDYLLFYDDPAKRDEAWARLVSDVKVSVAELGWSEKVVDHHIGYGRDGGIAMY